MVCASVVIVREKRESGVDDKMVGRFCNTLRMLLVFFGEPVEKGCVRGRMNASATLRRKEDRKEDDRARYNIATRERREGQ